MDFDEGMWFKHANTMKKVPIFTIYEVLTVYLEVVENHPFLHLDVHKFNKDVVRSAPWVTDEVKQLLGNFGYPVVFGSLPVEGKDALHKLYKKLGFEPLTEYHNHIIYQLFIKEPENYEDISLTREEEAAARKRDEERILRYGT